MVSILTFFTVLLTLWAGTSAAIDVYQFPDEESRERYQDLTWELRCPKCQNQNIADSNAPIAQDLRREVHRMVVEGHSDKEIVDFMVERYGDFVLYRPRMSGRTMILWVGPAVLVILGIIVVLILGRKNKVSQENDGLSEDERNRLRQLLDEAEHLSDKTDKP
ncbi:cytochrome c-type biogenesis protein CcmH [Hahella sp. CCB-MM4]|uniref:cytochrome c-type biogenesis protein n=1 Tax=Hahella sp. (strain CCB-MM4) TaxID=1926491 RepID=UPI00352B9286